MTEELKKLRLEWLDAMTYDWHQAAIRAEKYIKALEQYIQRMQSEI